MIALRHHKFLSLSTACIFLISVAGLSACAQPPPTPSNNIGLPPTEEWTADGIIEDGEYLDAMRYGDYEIYWASDEQFVYIGMKAKTNGFVAMAIQPGRRMKEADIVFGFVKDGEVIIFDLFSAGDFGPHSPDNELGGTDDILEFGSEEEGSYTTIEFKRALNTVDKYDHPLSAGPNKIIWSYGSTNDLNQKHTNRGYGEIIL